MCRYAVIDTDFDDNAPEQQPLQSRVLGTFHTEDSAKALALQRMAYGDLGVVVIDQETGERVFPRDEAGPGDAKQTSSSHTRLRQIAPQADQRRRAKSKG
jgi:hypothetical protein